MRRVASAGLAVALLLLASGCGNSSGSGAGSTSGTSQQRSVAAFSKCLKQHGVKGFGAPGQGQGFGGGGPPASGGLQGQPPSGGAFPGISSKMRKAFAACKSLVPRRQGGTPPAGFGNGG
jgi:hypothetical protein